MNSTIWLIYGRVNLGLLLVFSASSVKDIPLILLSSMLDPVEQALAHPYLATLHDINDEPICHSPFEFDFEQPSFSEEHIKELIMMEAIAFNPGGVEDMMS